MNVKQALQKHPEGRYYMSHNGQWLDVGTDALEAQRMRKQLDEFKRLSGKASAQRANQIRRQSRSRLEEREGLATP